MLGEKIYHQTINRRQETVNTSSFSPGIYFVKVIAGEKMFLQKLVVE